MIFSFIAVSIILFLYLFLVIFKYHDFKLQATTTFVIIAMVVLFAGNVILLTGTDRPMKWNDTISLINPLPDKMQVLSDYSNRDGTLHIWLLNEETRVPLYFSMPDPDRKKYKKLQKEKEKAKNAGGRKVYFHFKKKKKGPTAKKGTPGENQDDDKAADGPNFKADIPGRAIRKEAPQQEAPLIFMPEDRRSNQTPFTDGDGLL